MAEELEELIEELGKGGRIRFQKLLNLCKNLFGKPRIRGSHHIFGTGLSEIPIINIQPEKKDAKAYQVRQVLKVLKLLEELSKDDEEQGQEKEKNDG